MPSLKPLLKKLSSVILILTVFAFWADQYYLAFGGDEYEYCNVSDIKLQGDMMAHITDNGDDVSSSEDIVLAIENADQDDNIKAIILEIDSSGGYPVAGEEVANALKAAKKPTVAIIRQTGVSAAYWAATGADRIFASSLSDVGSIGVTMSYLDYAKQNEKEGLTYNQLSIGRYKDTGDPDKALTEEEKQLLERDIKITYEEFIKAVANNRNLDIEKVRILADGSSMMGKAALENGLIDQIGGLSEAREYLSGVIGNEALVCQE